MAVLIDLLILMAIIILLILIFGPIIVRWLWPPPPPPCGLVRSTVLPDYCFGTCPPGQTCAATSTRPYPAWMGGWAPSTQAATCACVPIPPPPGGIAPPGSGSSATAPTAPGDVAPVTGSSTTEKPR